MPNRGTRHVVTRLALTLGALALALPAAAEAADPAAVTISACRGDSISVVGKLKLTGNAARKARGASLQLRFEAMPLFGLPRVGQWRSAGRKPTGSGQAVFTGLGADNWVGTMSWRFKKGRKTVASGSQRSQPVRVGTSRGRATCTVAEGLKPRDVKPPTLFILPSDSNWYRAPATVQLLANDDFSGVKNVSYSLDGGPKTQIPNGGSFTISNEGQHKVDWEATDVAGNTATRSDVVRVDAAPPTKPALSKPASVTASTKPTFQWGASSDSGSGMKGYVLVIKRADGSIVSFQPVDASTTAVQSGATLNEGETYTAVLTAVDNTADKPWTQDSDPLTFRVDGNADASFSPPSAKILSGSQKSTNFTITLDRTADPSTVSESTVKLQRGGSDIAHAAGCSNTPCTVITVDPNSDLLEGRYTLSLNGVKSSDEGLTFAASATYAVPYVENGIIAAPSSSSLCPTVSPPAQSSGPYPLNAADPGTRAFLEFDIASAGAWTLKAMSGGNEIGHTQGPVGGPYRVEFPVPSGGGTVTFVLQAQCPSSGTSASASASNLFGSDIP